LSTNSLELKLTDQFICSNEMVLRFFPVLKIRLFLLICYEICQFLYFYYKRSSCWASSVLIIL
jgi:hypothetical protein